MTIVLRIINRIRSTFYRYCINSVYLFDCKGRTISDILLPDGYKIGVATNIGAVSNLDYSSDMRGVMIRRFSSGHVMYYVSYFSTIVSYGWKADNMNDFYVYEIANHIRFYNKHNVLYDFFTRPSYRRLGLYYALLLYIISSNKDSMIPLLIYADKNNHPSINAIRKAGFEKVGVCSHIRTRFDR